MAPIPDWRLAAPLLDAQRRLEELETITDALAAADMEAKGAADAAADKLLEVEGLHHLKRVNDATLKKAQQRAEETRKTAALARVAIGDHQRSIESLKSALPGIRTEAIQASIAALREAYPGPVRRLVEALAAAAAAATEVDRVFNAAREQFPPVYDVRDPDYRAWPVFGGLQSVAWPRDLEISAQAFEPWRANVRAMGLL